MASSVLRQTGPSDLAIVFLSMAWMLAPHRVNDAEISMNFSIRQDCVVTVATVVLSSADKMLEIEVPKWNMFLALVADSALAHIDGETQNADIFPPKIPVTGDGIVAIPVLKF